MDHAGGVAAGQLIVGMLFRIELLAQPPDEMPQRHGLPGCALRFRQIEPGMLGTGATLPRLASSMVMLFTSNVRPMA